MSTGAGTDERQPLLPPAALADDAELPVHDEENPTPVEQDSELVTEKKPRSWGTIAWYTFWTTLGIFFAVIFIKGFIDADDVEVCTTYQQEPTLRTDTCSLILVKL